MSEGAKRESCPGLSAEVRYSQGRAQPLPLTQVHRLPLSAWGHRWSRETLREDALVVQDEWWSSQVTICFLYLFILFHKFISQI